MESARDIWQRVLGELQVQVSKANYATWLKNSRGISCQGHTFIVGVPSAFVAEWLTTRLHSLIRKTLTRVLGRDIDIQFTVPDQDQLHAKPVPQASPTDGGTSTRVRADRFHSKHTFDTFVVGDANRMAYAAALDVAETAGQSYNPLFIYSDTGLGKTHLLHAIARRAADNGLQATYIGAEQFTNDFVLAIKQRQIEQFRNRFQPIHILLFDDIQFIANKRRTQQSFFHIFNELHNDGRQIVITADRPPQEMDLLSRKLRSRLECGLTTSIQPPNMETRLAILRAKADESSVTVSAEVLELLANRVTGNPRQLEGALIYLTAQARLTGEELTVQAVNRLLTAITGNQDKQLTIHSIADYFNLSIEQLTGKRRDRRTALARQIAMFLLRQEGSYSFSEIGRELGNRNHSTIVHGCQKISSEIRVDSKLCQQISEITERIKQNSAPAEGY